MPRYAEHASQYGLATVKSRRVSPILIALVLAMAVLVYLILAATVGGGDLIAPRYHFHKHLA